MPCQVDGPGQDVNVHQPEYWNFTLMNSGHKQRFDKEYLFFKIKVQEQLLEIILPSDLALYVVASRINTTYNVTNISHR